MEETCQHCDCLQYQFWGFSISLQTRLGMYCKGNMAIRCLVPSREYKIVNSCWNQGLFAAHSLLCSGMAIMVSWKVYAKTSNKKTVAEWQFMFPAKAVQKLFIVCKGWAMQYILHLQRNLSTFSSTPAHSQPKRDRRQQAPAGGGVAALKISPPGPLL